MPFDRTVVLWIFCIMLKKQLEPVMDLTDFFSENPGAKRMSREVYLIKGMLDGHCRSIRVTLE
jgi:hypothetical protein